MVGDVLVPRRYFGTDGKPTLDHYRKAEALLQEKMQQLTGGLPLPPGMKLI